MKYNFSIHALEQLERRKISRSEIDTVVQHPRQIMKGKDYEIYQKIISNNNKKYLLRVFINKTKQPPMVITAYKTSNITKYYEG